MRRALVAVLVAGCACASPRAQIRAEVPFYRDGTITRSVEAEVTAVTAGVRPGGAGHVRIELRNPHAEPHRIVAEVRESYFSAFRATAAVEVEAGGVARIFLPLPTAVDYARIELRADAAAPVPVTQVSRSRSGTAAGVSVLFVLAAGADESGWTAMLERRLGAAPPAAATRGGDPRAIAASSGLRPADLPPTWAGISGFDLVVVDGRAAGLDESAQRVLRDYLRAGGRLLAVAIDAMPAGPLRDVLSGDPTSIGFGMALALDVEDSSNLPGGPLRTELDRRLSTWLARADGFLLAGDRPTAGPLPPESYRPLAIPGLGKPPLRVFFLLIVAFAVVVGPVNYRYWKRRRRLPMLLLTVPLLGLVTTVVLLGYGILSEGLGVRAAERSLTVLDQVRREAVSWGSRTLYAGLSPGRFAPRVGTLVTCLAPFANWRGRAECTMEVGADGTIDGALVPSRIQTTIASVSPGTERARLRFERGADGTLAVLAGPELAPIAEPGAVLLRTADGAYWFAGTDGRMSRCDEQVAESARAQILDRYLRATGFSSGWNPPFVQGADWEHEGPVARLLRLASSTDGVLPPAHYLAAVADSPALDRMDVDGERAGAHVVLGRIGPEDLVD